MANAKFKIGDKVKVIGAKGFNDSTTDILEFIGKTGEITEVRKFPDGDIGYCFLFENNGMEEYCFDERSLEKVDETKNWFNIDIRSEGDRTVATYTDRNGKQKVSVFRYKDDKYDPKVAVDYLMQKVDFSGAEAKVEAKDDDWQCGDLVMWNDEKAEIVAMSKEYLLLDFKFENMYAHDAKGYILESLTEGMVDKDGKPWKSDGQCHYYIVNKNDPDLELIKAVRKVDVKIPEAPKKKPDPKDYPFAIGDRVYVRYLNDYGTVVAYRRGDRTVLAHMDGKNAHYHKGGHFEHRMIDADGNLFKAVKDEYWWVNDTNAEKIEDSKPEIEFPFEIGDRIYIKNRFSSRINNKAATVVAHDVLDGSCLVKVDVPDYDCFHKGNDGHSCKNIVDENGEPYKFSGKPEYWWITEKRFGELIKDEKPVSAKFNIGDRVMCTYGYSHTVTGYGTVVAYSNNYGLENGYLVKVDSEYRHDIPCHDGLKGFYEPYIAVGKKWTNESEEESFRYFSVGDLKKVK